MRRGGVGGGQWASRGRWRGQTGCEGDGIPVSARSDRRGAWMCPSRDLSVQVLWQAGSARLEPPRPVLRLRFPVSH